MGDEQSVQSRDYMTGRYNELLAAAKADPAKAQDFTSFSTQYLDFMKDYGDPRTRESVLKDLTELKDIFGDELQTVEKASEQHLMHISDIMDDLYTLDSQYQAKKSALDNNSYQTELDTLNKLEDIEILEKKYGDAQNTLENFNTKHQSTIDELRA